MGEINPGNSVADLVGAGGMGLGQRTVPLPEFQRWPLSRYVTVKLKYNSGSATGFNHGIDKIRLYIDTLVLVLDK